MVTYAKEMRCCLLYTSLVPEGTGEAAVEIVLPKVVVKSAPVVNLLACSFPRAELIRCRSLLHEAGRLLD